MSYMYRIGVIGDFDSVSGFMALGLDVFPVKNAEEGAAELKRLCAEEYGIIYITEPLMEDMQEVCAKVENELFPAIVPIPAGGGTTGFGTSRLREYVRQAVGSDIIFNGE